MRLIDADEIRWVDHFDSDGNLSKYKVAYSDEMPPTVEAVPVEWIEQYKQSIGSQTLMGYRWIELMQKAWAERKENDRNNDI